MTKQKAASFRGNLDGDGREAFQSTRLRPRDPFSYINRTYGLKLQRNAAVLQPATGRKGVVTGTHPGALHYIDIKWAGNPFAHGPFHPTDGLVYPEAA